METEQLADFVKRNRIHFSAELTDTNPNMASDDQWMRAANHWKVTFRCEGRQLTTYFSQGSGISRDPSAEDVLDCLGSDASGIENVNSFEQWACEYGYDTDSRKAEKTFKACERAAAKLEQFLGADEYQHLLWHTERL